MRSIAAEEGLVKLVHPGRHVEVLNEPTTAAEVMRKNPRHCVTRPDVFKFPWIVIKPESLLPPGKVFYVVPERTIYHLMKSEKHRFPDNANAGLTPKHRSHHSGGSERVMSRQRDDFSDGEDRSGEGYFLIPWLDHRFRKTYMEFREHSLSEDMALSGRKRDAVVCGGIDDDRRASTSHYHRKRDRPQEMPLKSCLKKPEGVDRKPVGLRVRFSVTEWGRESREKVRLIRV